MIDKMSVLAELNIIQNYVKFSSMAWCQNIL